MSGNRNGMGNIMREAVIDERGRIVIPNEVRAALKLRPQQKLRILIRGRELILSPEVEVDEFIAQLKGCVHGSRIKPEDLKDIWGVAHSHD
ncbi:MAG: AbrB family transcriptional regulator [Thermoprotei archaeon]